MVSKMAGKVLTGSGMIRRDEGGELKIEETKIGHWEMYTKLRFSFPHRDKKS